MVLYENLFDVNDDDIKHFIDSKYTAYEIMQLAKHIYPRIAETDMGNAYNILISGYKDYDNIEEMKELHSYIDDCVEKFSK